MAAPFVAILIGLDPSLTKHIKAERPTNTYAVIAKDAKLQTRLAK